MESQQNYYRYIYVVVVLLLFFYYVKRKLTTPGESIKDRIWRKIAFSYQEMLHTFDAAEKELLKHTFHNTIFNSKGATVTEQQKTPKKKVSNVQFDLNKNETLYY